MACLENIDVRHLDRVVAQKRPPCLRRRRGRTHHLFGNGPFADSVAQQAKF